MNAALPDELVLLLTLLRRYPSERVTFALLSRGSVVEVGLEVVVTAVSGYKIPVTVTLKSTGLTIRVIGSSTRVRDELEFETDTVFAVDAT